MTKKHNPLQGIRARTRSDGTVSYTALVKHEGKQLVLGTRDTPEEAQELRAAYFEERASDGLAIPTDTGLLTVRQLGEMCLSGKDLSRWNTRICAMADFADWPATQVSERDVKLWIDKMATTPIVSGRNAGELPTRGTLVWPLTLLRRVYDWAAKPAREYVTHNPARAVTISNSTDVKPKSKRNLLDYLREDEAKRIINAPETLIPLEPKSKFMVLMFSGARPGDVWRLSWERIDWSAESIRFTSRKTSKVEAYDYTVHALPQLMSALRTWWLRCGRPTHGFVFPSRDADGTEHEYPTGYDAGWQDKREARHYEWTLRDGTKKSAKRAVKVTRGWRTKLGIQRNVPLYALRHTCACQLLLGSDLFTGGRRWSREEIQSQLGHRDSKATEHYMRALGILGRQAAMESKAALTQKKREGR